MRRENEASDHLRGFVDSVDPLRDKAYLRPVARLTGHVAEVALVHGEAISIGCAGVAASSVELGVRRGGGAIARHPAAARDFTQWLDTAAATSVGQVFGGLAERLGSGRSHWAGLSLARPLVMGIVNVTPDSFSDGGKFDSARRAVDHARSLLELGADLIDVGGESTRPGATAIDPGTEMQRVLPVIKELAALGATVSIDTRHPVTMAAALDAGARIVNDVMALCAPGAVDAVSRAGASVILMHMQGDPATMQQSPEYDDVAFDVFDFLEERTLAAVAGGIPRGEIMLDPGIGFGKTARHNCELIRSLGLFRSLGCGVLLGASRKGFIGAVAGDAPVEGRIGGSVAAALAGVAAGADIVRVHDVRETVQALRVFSAIHE